MQILHLTPKKHWFDLMLSGEENRNSESQVSG